MISLFIFMAFPPVVFGGEKIRLPSEHLSIKTLNAGSSQVNYVPLIMCMPPTDGFSSNVNINVQIYSGSLEDYIQLSKSQFTQMDLNILRAEIIEGFGVFEYTGKIQKREMHCYAKVLKRQGKIYLITGTTLKSLWNKDKQEIIDCVNSASIEK